MADVKDVQEIMKYIEEITSKLQYSSFEVALLIAERSELTHKEVTPELVEMCKNYLILMIVYLMKG